MDITYTVFPDLTGATARRESESWPEFCAKIVDAQSYPTKEAMPLLKLATFGEVRSAHGSLRHGPNLQQVFGIEIEHDAGEMPAAEAASRLAEAGVAAIIYTTARHTAAAPRWRALMPLAAPCDAEQRRYHVGVANTILGGVLADESFTATQAFYFGKVAGRDYVAIPVHAEVRVDELEGAPAPLFPKSAESYSAAAVPDGDALRFLNVTEDTLDEVRSALAALGAHRAGPGSYPLWREIVCALKSLEHAGYAEEAWELALQFSKRGGPAFDLDALKKKWAEPTRKTTYKTILARAQEDGWVNPKSGRHAPDRPDGGRADLTDTGNCNVLYEITAGNLRFITQTAKWMAWDGHGWIIDEAGAVARHATLRVAEKYLDNARKMEQEAELATGDDRKRLLKVAERLRKWHATCRNRRSIDNMLALAAKDDRFIINVAQLDTAPWALGVANGVVDLRTGELRANSREDYITKRSDIAFHRDARAPRFEQFIAEITATPVLGGFNYRPEMAQYLHRAVGYWATGSTREHKMFALVGPPAAGKSLFTECIEKVMSAYCTIIPPEAMMSSTRVMDAERPTPYARALAGARIAFASEAKDGDKLNAAWVKRQTGDAKLTARGMKENAFTFTTSHKLVLITNHEPHLDHFDDATRSRIHVVPFDCRWNRPGMPRDPNLPDGDKHLSDKLMAEAEGILAWIVAGTVAYAREGLEPPAQVVAKTAAYFEQQDTFAQWLETMQRCPVHTGTGATALFSTFRAFAQDAGTPHASPVTLHAFAKELKSRGIESARPSTGTVYGLAVATAELF